MTLPAGQQMTIREANRPADWGSVQTLLREYADWLKIDLSFQNFEYELAHLAEMYGPPGGRMLIAELTTNEGTVAAGCVGVRRFNDLICEMKRLYVRPAYRGTGLGRRLALEILAHGRALGYQRMRLDTLEGMKEAQRLYRSLGFYPIPPYGSHDVPGTQFLEADLAAETKAP